MMYLNDTLFPGFEELYRKDRIKLIDISGEIFAFNVQDSILFKIENLPRKYFNDVVKTPLPPLKTLILHTTYKCDFSCKHCYINAGKMRQDEMDSKE